jgi:hypothetical protein
VQEDLNLEEMAKNKVFEREETVAVYSKFSLQGPVLWV